jgi:ABC-2 type transport system permease protein
MRNVWIIARRELYAYFTSPIAYLVAAAFLFLCGVFFIAGVTSYGDATLQSMFGSLSIVMIFVAPVLTMRLISREQDLGTIELLLTAPVRDWEVVVGKFLASYLFYLAMVLVTGFYPLILYRYGNPDLGAIGAGYLGLALLGAAMLSLGVFTSSLTRNQVIAAVIGVVARRKRSSPT